MSLPESRHVHSVKRTSHKNPARTLTTAKALALCCATLCAGIWLSVLNADWNWFARSGSLVVVIGMWLTSCQIIENSRRLKLRRAHHETNFHRDFANSMQHLSPNRLDDEDIWSSGLHGLYLLVTGTLVWGFGDLAGALLEALPG